MRILILGGTAEARELAETLVAAGHEVVTSLAGRTSSPMVPPGEVRVGKFGGVPGLVGYLRAMQIEHIVDATHPYAGLISSNAVVAARQTSVPLLRLLRPAWQEPAGADWMHVPDIAAAAQAIPSGSVALITTGHEGLEIMLARSDCDLIVRLIEPPVLALPAHARLLLDRPPYSTDAERELFAGQGITHLVSKNSGGPQTAAKLSVAQELDVPVIMIDRPSYGPSPETTTVDEVVAALGMR
jgi:precorrin-6A/cobalt-precorrin-6A reductase